MLALFWNKVVFVEVSSLQNSSAQRLRFIRVDHAMLLELCFSWMQKERSLKYEYSTMSLVRWESLTNWKSNQCCSFFHCCSSQPHDKKGGGCNWGSNVCGHNGLSTPGTICHSDLHWLQLLFLFSNDEWKLFHFYFMK